MAHFHAAVTLPLAEGLLAKLLYVLMGGRVIGSGSCIRLNCNAALLCVLMQFS